MINALISSVLAGAIASIVLVPMEDARIKMVGDPSWAKENVLTAIARLLRENGLIASFSGLGAMLAKQVKAKRFLFSLRKLLSLFSL
jgi:solute carrier family 25 phosphate transporter 3